jgi:DNA (cytosine-5)-methyltransferase 1
MNKIGIVDLFSGCGGLTDGFKKHGGFNTVAAVEWEKYPCETLKKRLQDKWGYKNANEIVMQFDIQQTNNLLNGWSSAKYGEHKGLLNNIKSFGSPDVVVGGPPCQAYSIAGRIRDKDGMQNDYRNYLFESYLEIVKGIGFPPVLIFENVLGILSAKPGGLSIIGRIKKAFNFYGYNVIENIRDSAVFNFAHYNVPQNRKRVIIVALSKKYFGKNSSKILEDIYNSLIEQSNKDSFLSVGKALSEMDNFFPLKEIIKVDGKKYSHEPIKGKMLNSVPRFHNKRDISIFKILTEDIKSGKNKYNNPEQLKKLYNEKTGKSSKVHKYHVLKLDKPGNTIPAHLYKDGLRHIHPDPKQSRTLTVREAARIQGFDDDFEFLGPIGEQYKMIGNAVSPTFSHMLSNVIFEILN